MQIEYCCIFHIFFSIFPCKTANAISYNPKLPITAALHNCNEGDSSTQKQLFNYDSGHVAQLHDE